MSSWTGDKDVPPQYWMLRIPDSLLDMAAGREEIFASHAAL